MSKLTQHELGWEVLAQPTGEVLTAEAHSPGLLLGLLGVPQGFETRDAEGWLYDVAGVSHESSATRPATRPIPAILDHALTGLLFSHAELWDQPGKSSPCSFAFVEGRGEIGFGWVGDAKVSVWVDGEPRDTGFVALRDGLGRLGRAWSIPSYHNVQVRISWHSSADGTAGGAEVEASWIADGRSAPGYHPVPVHGDWAAVLPSRVQAQEPEAGEATEAGAGTSTGPNQTLESPSLGEPIPINAEVLARGEETKPPRRRGFVAWLRSLFGLGEEENEVDEAEVWRVAAEEPVDVVATGTDDAIGFTIAASPSAGPTLQLAERPSSGFQHEAAGIEAAGLPADVSQDQAADAYESWSREALERGYEPESVPREAPVEADTGFDVVADGPALGIPPTPEAAELTERAAEWGAAEDPNAIELPSLEPAARLARIEESLRQAELEPKGLQLVGITPEEEPAASVPPVSGRIAESFAPEEHAGFERGAPLSLVPNEESADGPAAPESPALPSTWAVISPQHPAWPSPQELARTSRAPLVRHPWRWVALVAALFAGGWLVGGIQDDGRPRDASHRGRLADALHAVGLGGPRYLVQVNSRPPGAWITVDGQSLTLRTPAAIEATPGEHVIGLSFTEYGNASFRVQGRKGEHVPLDATLWGALDIISPDGVGVIGVAVDGVARGFAPLRVDSLVPGVHELRFTGPGLEPWGQTVEVKVKETRELLSRAVQSPSSGVLDVQASFTDETGSQPLKGAQVFIDSESRGVTPLVLDLPRGPHSVRLVYKGQEAPIQVIDLPGGNQRFAVFELGVENEAAHLTVDVPARIPRDRPAVLSATVVGIAPSEVREMWLHVQMPEGAWRRYAMTMLKAPAGAAGVVTFPTAAFDAQGKARYYVSAQSGQGDETFTELRSIALEAAPAH